MCVYGPIEVELPDASGIADKSWHCEMDEWLIVKVDDETLGEGREAAGAEEAVGDVSGG